MRRVALVVTATTQREHGCGPAMCCLEVQSIVEGVLLEVELVKINGVHDLRILSALTSLYITHLPLRGGRYARTYGIVVF